MFFNSIRTTAGVFSTFRKTYLRRTLKTKNEDDSLKISFVVFH